MTELDSYKAALRVALRYCPDFVRTQIRDGLARRDLKLDELGGLPVPEPATARDRILETNP